MTQSNNHPNAKKKTIAKKNRWGVHLKEVLGKEEKKGGSEIFKECIQGSQS